ncbi:hypothetical protein [Arenimonas sp.]|uniref:hypothetical protein n=1 Tax=Arenimonas sp. TaxID=1872635 RepID=UPI0039E2700C
MLRLVAALFLLLAPAALGLGQANAQTGIHRCVNAQGEAIFTDRDCSEMQAIDRPSPNAVVGSSGSVAAARSCALSRDDLLYGVRAALEAQDVNKLAAYYLWTGIGTREAYALMDRLSRFSEQPLMDVQLVMPERRDDPFAERDDTVDTPPLALPGPLTDTPADASDPETPNSAEQSLREESPLLPAPPPARRGPGPRMMRVDQTRAQDDAGSVITYFRIVPSAGCWWIRY